MSFLSSINPMSLAATAMFGPLGGIASQIIGQIASQIGQQIIQKLGDQLGLPQSVIDMAQGAFASSVGDQQGAQLNLKEAIDALGQEFGASPSEVGNFQRVLEDAINGLVADLAKSQEERSAAGGGKGGAAAGGAAGAGAGAGAGGGEGASGADGAAGAEGTSGGGIAEKGDNPGGWLMAIAEALGEKLDKMADDMSEMADKLSKDDPSMTAKFSALTQQFSMMFNATSTAIKTIGEAMANTARKQ